MNTSKKKTILVVEDNPVMRKALLETLKVLDYDTLEAANGVEALRIIEGTGTNGSSSPGREVSLVMSDLSMPEMDGQELFYELKSRHRDIPLVMLTGYVVTNELDELRNDGLSGWLLKPADIEQIARMLHQILV